jgi:putative aldouronate transport system permease protein
MQNLKKELRLFKHNSELLLLALPGLLLLAIFNYAPMFGVILAFKNYDYGKKIFGSPWVGFDNFKFFFTSQDAFRITRNTILYNAGFILIGTALSVIFALILFELSKRAVKVFQTAFLIPYFISWVVVGFVLYALLNPDLGVVNKIIALFGADRKLWYSEPDYWPFILMLSYLWKNAGYNCIIFYTGLMGIDLAYFEAAKIDGATKLQQICRISIPLLRPLIILLSLLAVGRIFYSDFGLFYFIPMNSGILYEVTDVIDTYVYKALRTTGDIGMASAVGLYQSMVGFILVLLSNKLVKRFDENSGIF